MKLTTPSLITSSVVAFAALFGCQGVSQVSMGGVTDAGHPLDAGPSTSDGGRRDAGSTVDAGNGQSAFDVVGVEVSPATTTLQARLGERLTQAFTAQVVRRDGSKASGRFIWSQDPAGAGDLDPISGVFTTNGLTGATVKITATTISGTPVSGDASVSINLSAVVFSLPTPNDVPSRFATVGPASADSASIVYPLDRAVMPQNVYPADVQWANGEPGDVFRVRLSKSMITVTAYLLHSGAGFDNHWLVDEAAWRALAQTAPDEAATLNVDRWRLATQTALASPPIHLTFARAALSGTVYFWSVNDGRIFRVNDGSGTRSSFMPTPPVTGGDRCVGCHSVSPSGRYMAGRLGGGDNWGTVFDLTTDLAGDPPPSLFPLETARWFFSTWSPDETRLLVSDLYAALKLINPATGAQLAVGGQGLPTGATPGRPGVRATHPAWSPDGKTIAFTTGVPDWGVDYTEGDLGTLAVTGPDSFGAPVTILKGNEVPGQPADQRAVSYPAWTPDSKKIVFAHGATARSANSPGKLFIANKDGTAVQPLTRANNNESKSYEPHMSPFDSGGYFWLAFLSRRPYGNAAVGHTDATAQLWVTAIKKNAAPGEDPSAVAYWLPGQSPKSATISGYWAPRACRATGVACGVGSECCSNDCRPPTGGGGAVCSPPPPDRCRVEGETCGGAGECCGALKCELAVCRVAIN